MYGRGCQIHPADPPLWDDLEQLFEERGRPKSCWCMVSRGYGRPTVLTGKAAPKTGMQGRVADGEKVGLILFLTNGRIDMDRTAVERIIRSIALQRNNALFAGHDAGAQNWAVIASLIETCKLNKIEPHSYLTRVPTAIVN